MTQCLKKKKKNSKVKYVCSILNCSPTKCQAQKQNQKVEFNTINIEQLYFQMV